MSSPREKAEKYVTLEVGNSAMLVFRTDLEKAFLAGYRAAIEDAAKVAELGVTGATGTCVHIAEEIRKLAEK